MEKPEHIQNLEAWANLIQLPYADKTHSLVDAKCYIGRGQSTIKIPDKRYLISVKLW